MFVRLCRTDKAIRLEWRKLRIDRRSLYKILQIGLPAGVQSAMFSVSNIVIQSAINSLGTAVMVFAALMYYHPSRPKAQ